MASTTAIVTADGDMSPLARRQGAAGVSMAAPTPSPQPNRGPGRGESADLDDDLEGLNHVDISKINLDSDDDDEKNSKPRKDKKGGADDDDDDDDDDEEDAEAEALRAKKRREMMLAKNKGQPKRRQCYEGTYGGGKRKAEEEEEEVVFTGIPTRDQIGPILAASSSSGGEAVLAFMRSLNMFDTIDDLDTGSGMVSPIPVGGLAANATGTQTHNATAHGGGHSALAAAAAKGFIPPLPNNSAKAPVVNNVPINEDEPGEDDDERIIAEEAAKRAAAMAEKEKKANNANAVGGATPNKRHTHDSDSDALLDDGSDDDEDGPLGATLALLRAGGKLNVGGSHHGSDDDLPLGSSGSVQLSVGATEAHKEDDNGGASPPFTKEASVPLEVPVLAEVGIASNNAILSPIPKRSSIIDVVRRPSDQQQQEAALLLDPRTDRGEAGTANAQEEEAPRQSTSAFDEKKPLFASADAKNSLPTPPQPPAAAAAAVVSPTLASLDLAYDHSTASLGASPLTTNVGAQLTTTTTATEGGDQSSSSTAMGANKANNKDGDHSASVAENMQSRDVNVLEVPASPAAAIASTSTNINIISEDSVMDNNAMGSPATANVHASSTNPPPPNVSMATMVVRDDATNDSSTPATSTAFVQEMASRSAVGGTSAVSACAFDNSALLTISKSSIKDDATTTTTPVVTAKSDPAGNAFEANQKKEEQKIMQHFDACLPMQQRPAIVAPALMSIDASAPIATAAASNSGGPPADNSTTAMGGKGGGSAGGDAFAPISTNNNKDAAVAVAAALLSMQSESIAFTRCSDDAVPPPPPPLPTFVVEKAEGDAMTAKMNETAEFKKDDGGAMMLKAGAADNKNEASAATSASLSFYPANSTSVTTTVASPTMLMTSAATTSQSMPTSAVDTERVLENSEYRSTAFFASPGSVGDAATTTTTMTSHAAINDTMKGPHYGNGEKDCASAAERGSISFYSERSSIAFHPTYSPPWGAVSSRSGHGGADEGEESTIYTKLPQSTSNYSCPRGSLPSAFSQRGSLPSAFSQRGSLRSPAAIIAAAAAAVASGRSMSKSVDTTSDDASLIVDMITTARFHCEDTGETVNMSFDADPNANTAAHVGSAAHLASDEIANVSSREDSRCNDSIENEGLLHRARRASGRKSSVDRGGNDSPCYEDIGRDGSSVALHMNGVSIVPGSCAPSVRCRDSVNATSQSNLGDDDDSQSTVTMLGAASMSSNNQSAPRLSNRRHRNHQDPMNININLDEDPFADSIGGTAASSNHRGHQRNASGTRSSSVNRETYSRVAAAVGGGGSRSQSGPRQGSVIRSHSANTSTNCPLHASAEEMAARDVSRKRSVSFTRMLIHEAPKLAAVASSGNGGVNAILAGGGLLKSTSPVRAQQAVRKAKQEAIQKDREERLNYFMSETEHQAQLEMERIAARKAREEKCIGGQVAMRFRSPSKVGSEATAAASHSHSSKESKRVGFREHQDGVGGANISPSRREMLEEKKKREALDHPVLQPPMRFGDNGWVPPADEEAVPFRRTTTVGASSAATHTNRFYEHTISSAASAAATRTNSVDANGAIGRRKSTGGGSHSHSSQPALSEEEFGQAILKAQRKRRESLTQQQQAALLPHSTTTASSSQSSSQPPPPQQADFAVASKQTASQRHREEKEAPAPKLRILPGGKCLVNERLLRETSSTAAKKNDIVSFLEHSNIRPQTSASNNSQHMGGLFAYPPSHHRTSSANGPAMMMMTGVPPLHRSSSANAHNNSTTPNGHHQNNNVGRTAAQMDALSPYSMLGAGERRRSAAAEYQRLMAGSSSYYFTDNAANSSTPQRTHSANNIAIPLGINTAGTPNYIYDHYHQDVSGDTLHSPPAKGPTFGRANSMSPAVEAPMARSGSSRPVVISPDANPSGAHRPTATELKLNFDSFLPNNSGSNTIANNTRSGSNVAAAMSRQQPHKASKSPAAGITFSKRNLFGGTRTQSISGVVGSGSGSSSKIKNVIRRSSSPRGSMTPRAITKQRVAGRPSLTTAAATSSKSPNRSPMTHSFHHNLHQFQLNFSTLNDPQAVTMVNSRGNSLNNSNANPSPNDKGLASFDSGSNNPLLFASNTADSSANANVITAGGNTVFPLSSSSANDNVIAPEDEMITYVSDDDDGSDYGEMPQCGAEADDSVVAATGAEGAGGAEEGAEEEEPQARAPLKKKVTIARSTSKRKNNKNGGGGPSRSSASPNNNNTTSTSNTNNGDARGSGSPTRGPPRIRMTAAMEMRIEANRARLEQYERKKEEEERRKLPIRQNEPLLSFERLQSSLFGHNSAMRFKN